MGEKIASSALDVLFNHARTHNVWLDKPVSDEILKELYDLAKLPPTAANCQPLRVVFVKSKEAKERLKPFLAEGNVEKTMLAPVTAIIAYDKEFYEKLPFLFPFVDAKSWYDKSPDFALETAIRNGTLQGGYFILAARALGLDCGPMSGFDNKGLDKEFFPDGKVFSNFLCNLGYGDVEKLHKRAPRLEFKDACSIE